MKIADHLVQLLMEDEWDTSILTRESFPVNIRLYKINKNYRNIILEIVRYMDEHLRSSFEDYQAPRGVAAPSLGFPFRIIGYKKTAANENQFCLNPKILTPSQAVSLVQTNCGSIRLPHTVSAERHNTIDLEYYDLEGNPMLTKCIYRASGGFTIQHEVNQCDGITILDHRPISKKTKPESET